MTSELADFFCPELVPGERYDLANIVMLVATEPGLPPMALRTTGLPSDAPTEQIESWIHALQRVATAAEAITGVEILDRLIVGADVLVENFKLGTLEKLGLTPTHLEELNPRLVVGSVNGFGMTGPLKDDAGLDQVIQGMSGLMSVTGSGVGDIYRVGVPIVDITSGMICAIGIVSALVGRSTGHPVSHVSTSLLETALNLSVFQGQRALSLGETPVPQGTTIRRSPRTARSRPRRTPSTSPSATTSNGTLSATY